MNANKSNKAETEMNLVRFLTVWPRQREFQHERDIEKGLKAISTSRNFRMTTTTSDCPGFGADRQICPAVG